MVNFIMENHGYIWPCGTFIIPGKEKKTMRETKSKITVPVQQWQ